jgi:hypothetical protein
VLVLLEKLNLEMRDKMMFIWWRACHRNGKASIENSIGYLQSYLATLQNLAKGKLNTDRK